MAFAVLVLMHLYAIWLLQLLLKKFMVLQLITVIGKIINGTYVIIIFLYIYLKKLFIHKVTTIAVFD